MSSEKNVFDALLAKIYASIAGEDPVNDNVSGERPYVSFCRPGVPIAEVDLDFGYTLMTGAQTEAASDFSFFVNTIPNPTGFWSDTGRRVFEVYKDVLRFKVLPNVVLSDAEKQALKDAKALLTATQYVIKPGGITEAVTVDSLLVEKYEERKATYENAKLKYNMAYLTSISDPTNALAQMEWSLNEPVYKSQLQTAWQKFGEVKGAVEEARATISNIEGRGPQSFWNDLQLDFDTSERAGNFYLTKYFPNKFWQNSWSTPKFSERQSHTVDTSSSSSWGGGGGFSVGLWSFGADASHSSAKESHVCDVDGLEVEFELATIPIRRTWFSPSIFLSRGWKLDQAAYPNKISDGKNPPSGMMVCYPTAMIVARNVKLKFDKTSTNNSSAMSSFSTSGSVGWGPFSLRGNYRRSNSSSTHDFAATNDGLLAPGMQVIGFVNQMLPECPNPNF